MSNAEAWRSWVWCPCNVIVAWVVCYVDGSIKCGVLWTVCILSIHTRHEWDVRRLMDPSKVWMYCLLRGMGSSKLTQPPPSSPNRRSSSSTSGILWHLFDPTLVLEECFWGGYFIMCWYTLIVTLTYSENGLCYCICNFIVRSLLL